MKKLKKHEASSEVGDPVVGERLAAIRLRAGLTQTELANRINVSRQHISNIETGFTSPTLRVLTGFLETCGVSLPEFFYGPLPTDQTPKQREYHRRLQTISRICCRICDRNDCVCGRFREPDRFWPVGCEMFRRTCGAWSLTTPRCMPL